MKKTFHCKSGACAETILDEEGCFPVTDVQGTEWLCREISQEEMNQGMSVGEALTEYVLPAQRATKVGTVGDTVSRKVVCELDELPEALCHDLSKGAYRSRASQPPKPAVCVGGPYDGIELFAEDLNRRCVVIHSTSPPRVFMPNRDQWDAIKAAEPTERPALSDPKYRDRICYGLERTDLGIARLIYRESEGAVVDK